MRRALTSLVRIAGVLLVCALFALAGATYWLAGTEAGLRWAADQARALSGGHLVIEAPVGTLAGVVRADRVAYRDEHAVVNARAVELAMRWRDLLRGTLRIEALGVRALQVALLPAGSAPSKPPASIALPFGIEAHLVQIGELELWREAGRFAARDLAFSYEGGLRRHHLRLERLVVPGVDLRGALTARASGDVTIASRMPFAIGGALQVSGEHASRPFDAAIDVSGSLEQMRLVLRASAHGASLQAQADVRTQASVPLGDLTLALSGVDLSQFDAAAPRTRLAVDARMHGTRDGLEGELRATNAVPGALDAAAVPLRDAQLRLAWSAEGVSVSAMTVGLTGDARIDGRATVRAEGTTLDLTLQAVDLAALHTKLRSTRLSGTLGAMLTPARQDATLSVRDEALQLDAVLRHEEGTLHVDRARLVTPGGSVNAEGRLVLEHDKAFDLTAELVSFDPSVLGNFPKGGINARVAANGRIEPELEAELQATLPPGTLLGESLSGTLRMTLVPNAIRHTDVALKFGGNALRAYGGLGQTGETLEVALDAPALTAFDPAASGILQLRARLSGMLRQPDVSFGIEAHSIAWQDRFRAGAIEAQGTASLRADARFTFGLDAQRVVVDRVEVANLGLRVQGTRAKHGIELNAVRGNVLDAQLRLAGGVNAQGAWRGTLERLENRGAQRVELMQPASLEASTTRVALGPARLRVLGGSAQIDTLRWERGRVSSNGQLRQLPLGPLLRILDVHGVESRELALNGEWSLALTPRLNGSVRIERSGGDVSLGMLAGRALQIEQAGLNARITDDVTTIDAELRATGLGSASARLRIDPDPRAPSGTIGAAARLDGSVRAELPRLAVFEGVLGAGAAIDGSVVLNATVGGALVRPVVQGTLEASGVKVDQPVWGLALRDGAIRATLTPEAVVLERATIRAASGELSAQGALRLDRQEGNLSWRSDALRVLNRPDRQLVASGAGTLALDERRLSVRGEVRADEGVLEFQRERLGRSGEDVVVEGRKPPPPPEPLRIPVDLDMTLDVGTKLRIVAAGLQTGLRGRGRVQTGDDGKAKASGEIDAVKGVFEAFGQRLVIERGRLLFRGPLDDPGLDIVALRKNLDVQAGVQVSGSLREPRVRLTSDPPVPDAEKLSWLLSGKPPAEASAGDAVVMQGLAATLLTDASGVPLTRRMAKSAGLDDIRVGAASGGHEGQVIAFGKQLADRVYVEFEQGMDRASALARVSLTLTRTLSARAEADAQRSKFGVNYRRSFD